MIKKLNQKGFTLIEILAVIVVLSILIGLIIPIVTGYVKKSKKNLFISTSSTIINAVRENNADKLGYSDGEIYYLNSGCFINEEKIEVVNFKECIKQGGIWHEKSINDLLETKLEESPFGNKYLEGSYIEITDNDNDLVYEFNICLTDGENGVIGKEDDIKESFGDITSCGPPQNDDKYNTSEDNLDESGANLPQLPTSKDSNGSTLIAVYYDEKDKTWKKADSNNKKVYYEWYDYENKKWANAVTVNEDVREKYVNASLGTEILIDDINTMWVWIPRFIATGDFENYNGGTKLNPGAFDITFVTTTKKAHEAFTFGDTELEGFWVSKFELSLQDKDKCTPQGNSDANEASSAIGEGCNLTTIKPFIVPNKVSWRGASVSTYFYAIKEMTNENNIYGLSTKLDTHMIKNSEWGAVSYLTQSIYGRCTSSTNCTEIGVNNNKNYFTGFGAPANSKDGAKNDSYTTTLGINASTTNNPTGVYDLSGGAEEYVMGVYGDNNNTIWSGYSIDKNWHSFFNGYLNSDNTFYTSGKTLPSDNYYNVYKQFMINGGYSSNEGLDYENYGQTRQHALTETKGWYGDNAKFVTPGGAWFVRGGKKDATLNAGIFAYDRNYGNGTILFGTRGVLINK